MLEAEPKFRAWGWPALIVIVAAITLWRSSGYLVAPELRAEDGLKVFSYFYEHRSPSFLFHIKAGYTPFLPNILGWLSVRLPPVATPYFLTLMPTLLAVVTTSVFGAPAYRRYVASDSIRYAVCLAVAIAPVGPSMTVVNTDYSIWNALLLLMWLVLVPMPRSKLGSIAFACALSVLIWTHPLSVVALPATLLWVWREPRLFGRVLQGLLALCQGAHIWLGTQPTHAAFTKGGGPINRLGELVSGVVQHVCHEVIVYTFFPWGPDAAWFGYAMTGLCMLSLLGCALLRKERALSAPLCAWLAYAIVVPMALVVASRAERGLNATRYHYVSRAFAEVACCLIIAQVIQLLTRWAPRLHRFGLLPALSALAYISYLGIETRRSARFEGPDLDNAKLVRQFFSDLASAEREQGGYCNIHLRCNKRHRDWPFGVDTRNTCDK